MTPKISHQDAVLPPKRASPESPKNHRGYPTKILEKRDSPDFQKIDQMETKSGFQPDLGSAKIFRTKSKFPEFQDFQKIGPKSDRPQKSVFLHTIQVIFVTHPTLLAGDLNDP